MKFSSVKEYFYKLSNTGYQLMMVPFILFIVCNSKSIFDLTALILVKQEMSEILFFASCGLSLMVLTIVQIVTRRKANAIAKEVGLGIKLEKLGTLLKNKMVVLSSLVLFMPLILLFTGDNYFSIVFGVLSLWYFLQWPTPGRVCRLLKLKGDEREMVITRGEAFK
jgi:nitrogen fixation/metabolism regulation signal transduction histidine kinase